MAQKRKTNHSKRPGKSRSSKLENAASLLREIEEKTQRQVQRRLDGSWRDNLFEIIMTRVDLAAPHKKIFAALPAEFRNDPSALPHFARLFWGTMSRMLKLAKGPARPHHVAAFGVLYASIIDTFLKDDTRDHAKTMAALDKRLGLFEQFVDLSRCR